MFIESWTRRGLGSSPADIFRHTEFEGLHHSTFAFPPTSKTRISARIYCSAPLASASSLGFCPFLMILMPFQDHEAAQQLTDRVKRTVSTVRMKKEIFKRYVNDIQGVTGLGDQCLLQDACQLNSNRPMRAGAVAAQEYVRKVIEQRQLVWGDLLMIVMLSRPLQMEAILLRTTREVLVRLPLFVSLSSSVPARSLH